MANSLMKCATAWLALMAMCACTTTSTKTQMIEITSNPPGAEVEFRQVGLPVQAGVTPFVAERKYQRSGHHELGSWLFLGGLAAGLGGLDRKAHV